MVKRLVSAVAAAAGLVPAAALAAPAAPSPIVFFDIAATDLTREAAFYKAVLGWDVGADGRLTVPVASPLPGTVRIEAAGAAPIAERVLYVGVPDIPASLEAVKAHGGSVVFGRMVVPGVVILALFQDPAGNRMGLVEITADGKPVVPSAR